MVQLKDVETLEAKDIQKLVDLIQPELNKRKALYKRYKRKIKDSDLIFNHKGNNVVPFERYAINTASGYLGGKAPKYIVENTSDETKKTILKKLLQKFVGDDKYTKEMEVWIDHITNYNDDSNEHYNLVKNVLVTSACYEIVYENEDNEIVYSFLDPLQTVAIWDYSTPRTLIGLVRYYVEQDVNGTETEVIELIDKVGTRTFQRTYKPNKRTKIKVNNDTDFIEIYKTDAKGKLTVNNHNWGDVPATVVEQEDGIALIEPIIDLVKDYEQLLQNGVNTFQYNDQAKLKVTGYAPEEPLTVEKVDSDGNKYTVPNDKRIAEDKQFLEAKVFYTPNKDGDIAWIMKDVNDGAFQNSLKTLIDLILMMTGVPNVTDLGFTKADNASAIDRKFFNLEQMTIDIVTQLQMAYKRRWELIFNRLNLKFGTKYDFRDVKIELQKNLPANESEVVDSWLKLRGLVSDETIIERLPYGLDALVEQGKMEEQEQSQLEKDLNRQDSMNSINAEYDKLTKSKNNDIIKEEKEK